MNREDTVYVKLKELPSYVTLARKVEKVVSASSWWEKHGVDCLIAALALVTWPIILPWLASPNVVVQIGVLFVLGCSHSILTNKTPHLAGHTGLTGYRLLDQIVCFFGLDIVAGFPTQVMHEAHIMMHHPHTNIIDLGDSSTWRHPIVPCYVYMFLTPFLVPIITIPVGFSELWGRWNRVAMHTVMSSLGILLQLYPIMYYSGFNICWSFLCLLFVRGTMSIPYIHINVFQHIGLPIFSKEKRPVRLYQMSHGCLNLDRNWLLDIVFGHSLINCHVEHHLFPRLSDQMCLKVKPVVQAFLEEAGLPYQEESYTSRLRLFIDQYKELMQDVPPVTHFVGIQ